jgi:hypothetical protein
MCEAHNESGKMMDQSEISRLEQSNVLGLEFLRTMILLNGGAILATLSIVGNVSATSAIQFEITYVRSALWSFLAAIATVLVALLVSYSFIATNPESGYHRFWNEHIVLWNSFLALVSIFSFCLGVSFLIWGSQVG